MSALDRIDFEALGRELIAFRRDFHKYAESAWTEYRTTARIISELEKLGLPVTCGADPGRVMEAVLHDKKMYAGKARAIFVEQVGTFTERELSPGELRSLYTGYFFS